MIKDDGVTFGALVLPEAPWDELSARYARLDAGGLDALYSCDHFTNPHRPGSDWFEGSIALAGLAQATSNARVGLLVGAIVSRSPMLLVQQSIALDHLSAGRVIVGLGAGGAPTDQHMWGAPDWSPGERAARFAEYVELVDRLLRDREVTSNGQYYRTERARTEPGPRQTPRPPLLLAGHGPKTLDVVARHADVWNTYGPSLADAQRNSKRLDDACASVGRSQESLRRSVLFGIRADTAWTSAGEFADLVRRWHEAGFRDFVFYDPPYAGSGLPTAPPSTADELLAETIPALREEFG